MPRDNSDSVEDVGRLQSQNALRNRTNTRYLSDAENQNDADYDEVMETIERQRKMFDAAEHGYLNSLDMSVHEKAFDKIRHSGYDSDDEEDSSIFTTSKDLLETSRKASSAISTASKGSNSYASYEQSRKNDQERVKDVIVAGKRVFERELGDIRRDSKQIDENREVNDQAKAIFVGQRQQVKDGDVGRSLKYMQKGVKKMAKGLDSDV